MSDHGMTSLQHILRDAYREAWIARNSGHTEIGECLFRLIKLRASLARKQARLEMIGAELKASGYEKADDYLARVWSMAPLKEHEIDPMAPRAEADVA